MTGGGQRSIAKIRTFNGDVSRARNTSSTPSTIPAAQVPLPAVAVTPTSTAVPPPPHEVRAIPIPARPVTLAVPPVQPQSSHTVTPQPEKPIIVDAAAITDALSDFKAIPTSNLASQNFDTVDDPLASEGTIVSDKRRKRFKLLPAIGTAVSDWATDTKTNLTKKETGATVTKAESRIDTLKAAALASHQVPHDDHGVVLKRLTEVPRTPVSTGANIKVASTVAAPTWKHVADTAIPDEPEPEAPAPVRQAIVHVRRDVPPVVTTPVQPVPQPPPVPTPVPVPVPVAPSATVTSRFVPPAEQYRTPPPAPTPIIQSSSVTERTPTRTFATPTPARRITALMFVPIIVGASLLGIGVATLWYMGTQPVATSTTLATPVPSLVTTDRQAPVPINPDRIATLNELLGATLSTTETQQLYLTTADQSGTVRPADAFEILTALSFRVPGNFSRSIRAMSFGSYAGTHPFIVIRSSDFSTAFAGMLAWESTMSADLMPLFGSAVNESFDPTARTATQVRAAFFKDTIMANLSTRVLVDGSNTERIVYGFVKPNIILIAPNEETFTAIAPRIIETP